MKWLAVLLVLFLPSSPHYQRAVPGYKLQFPRDAFAHPEFANEWWYFTGNLATAQGRQFGFELTFFRLSPAPGTPLERDLFLTHFAISDISGKKFSYWTRMHRGDWGQAGAGKTAHGFRMWNENWQATFDESGPRHLQAAWGAMKLDLDLDPGARMLNGQNGWSQKGAAPGEASYYYSFPHVTAHGTVDGNQVSGPAWMDHEFASDQLASDQVGWNWMGLHLPQGDLMLFNLRRRDGARDPYSAGTWRPRDGAARPFSAADFTLTPIRSWGKYPVSWRVQVPAFGLDFTLAPQLDDQELHDRTLGVSYWEGAVTTSNGGEGYLELTGYAQPFRFLP